MIDWNPPIERMILAIHKWNELNPSNPFEWTFGNTLMIKAISERNVEDLNLYTSAIERSNENKKL